MLCLRLDVAFQGNLANTFKSFFLLLKEKVDGTSVKIR